MTTAELRLEIAKEIDKLPESLLPELLAFLQHVKAEISKKDQQRRNFQQILAEDGGLFKRLAQYDTEL